jgi:PmbA protein
VKISDFEDLGERILKIAERQRAEEAEAYLVSNRVLTVRLVNNSVFEAKGVHDFGVGVRVLRGGGLGFSSTADFTSKSLKKTVKAALDASKGRKLPFRYSFPSPAKPPEVRGVYDSKLARLPSDEVVDLAYQMVEESLAYNRRIVDNAGVFNLVVYHTLVMNSHGLKAGDRGTSFEASLTATAKRGARSSEGAEATAGRSLKELKLKEIGRKAAEMAVSGLKAQTLKERTYRIVLDPEPAVDIGRYVGRLCSPRTAKLYYPLFLDKLEKKVGSEELTVVDDPLMPYGVGSAPVDEEGVPSQKIAILEKGILKSFVYDTFHGAMERKRSTASGMRTVPFIVGVSSFPGKNYNGEPIPIPRNPYIVPGDWKREEIIEETENGLLVKRFHYTRLTNPTRGDFTSVLRMGLYRVVKGEVIGALKKSRLIDNFLDVLKSVDAVSDTLSVAGAWGRYSHAPTVRTKAHVAPV